jgi:predicted P-loop ATPase
MTTLIQPPPMDPWKKGVRAADVPVAKLSSEVVLFPAISGAFEGWLAPDAKMVEFAFYYARRGWHVFPCTRKVPLTPRDKDANGNELKGTGGFYKASTNEDQIRAWWIKHPYALIGIRAGEKSGVFAIDPDGPRGWQTGTRLSHRMAVPFPPTHAHRTPGGGKHLVFKWHADRKVTNSPGKLKGMGIDVRGQGGYFIAPPSIGKHGKRYEIADPADFFQFAEAPDWLYELIVKKPPPLPTQPADDSIIERALATIRPPGSLSAMANRPYVDAVLRGEYEAVASIPSEGCQNDQLNISSMKLGKYVASGVINEHEAIDTMMAACTANGLLDETGRDACMATIDSGMSFGKTQPKGIPERKAGDATGEPIEWRECKANGKPKPSMHNARLAITALGIVCSRDTFHNKTLFGYRDETLKHELQSIVGEVSDDGIIALRQLMSDRFGFDLEDKATRDAVKSLALGNCFNPVCDLIDKAEAEWDGIKRLDRMAAEYFNCADTKLNRAFIRKTMIALVARARVPGIKFDTITVLESPEGFNKSTAWRVLAGDENYSDERIIGSNAREVQEQLSEIWIHENADLAGLKKAEVETVKAYASRQTDIGRPAFAHFVVKQPRHSIEVGTTNSDEYLQSQTGNRRFWPLKVTKTIDIEKLRRDRLQLLGEAAKHQSSGENIVLDESLWATAGEEQEHRRVKDPWENVLENVPYLKDHEYFRGGVRTAKTVTIIHVDKAMRQELIAASDLLEYVLDIPIAQQTVTTSMRLSTVMRQLGWERNSNGRVTIKGERVKGYFRHLPPTPKV